MMLIFFFWLIFTLKKYYTNYQSNLVVNVTQKVLGKRLTNWKNFNTTFKSKICKIGKALVVKKLKNVFGYNILFINT